MAKKFQELKVGDQLEMPYGRSFWGGPTDKKRDPNMPSMVVVVTHRWHDPYERKEFVALAAMRRNGEWDADKPNYKHTITGVASAGYRPADRDWSEFLKAKLRAAEIGIVIPINRPKKIRWNK